MPFNFGAAIAQSQRLMHQRALEAIVLGPSGAGKSYVMGTFGVPTLYIYSTGESHGPRAAHRCAAGVPGSDIIPVCMDLTELDEKLDGDAVLQRVLDVLGSDELFDHHKIGAVVIDGAAELETYIRASERWRKACLTQKQEHNSFAEPAATTALFRPIFNRLKELQRTREIHFAVTCMLDVKEYGEFKDIVEAVPRLKGYSVAEMLIQQFGDVLVLSPMQRDGERKWKFQFMTDIVKTSKDLKQTVKRTINFSPRLNGVTAPPYVDADFREILKLKQG